MRHFERICGPLNSKQITQKVIDDFILTRDKEVVRPSLNKGSETGKKTLFSSTTIERDRKNTLFSWIKMARTLEVETTLFKSAKKIIANHTRTLENQIEPDMAENPPKLSRRRRRKMDIFDIKVCIKMTFGPGRFF